MEEKSLGFIILRHVNDSKTNKYWMHSYDCIRKFYPENHILIIDDNSDLKFLSAKDLYKTSIINSEYPKRGELLSYYYFLKHKLFDIAVIIHDSVFINKYIDFSIDKYKIIWDFAHNWDKPEDEIEMINVFNCKELLNFYNNKKLWRGCFGGMSIISYEYLESINSKYNLSLLLDKVITRYNRCRFERVIAVLLQFNYKQGPLLGDIHKYCRWGINYEQIHLYRELPIIKVWTGR